MSNASKLEICLNNFPDYNFSLESFWNYILFIIKNVTDFFKMVQTSVDLCLSLLFNDKELRSSVGASAH